MNFNEEELTIDEQLWSDIDNLVVAYMKLVPDTTFTEEDFWNVVIGMLTYFNESIGKLQKEKLKLQNRKLLTDMSKKI